jgi:hypothetical protein
MAAFNDGEYPLYRCVLHIKETGVKFSLRMKKRGPYSTAEVLSAFASTQVAAGPSPSAREASVSCVCYVRRVNGLEYDIVSRGPLLIPASNDGPTIHDMPNEILGVMFDFVEPATDTLGALRLCCKTFKAVVDRRVQSIAVTRPQLLAAVASTDLGTLRHCRVVELRSPKVGHVL